MAEKIQKQVEERQKVLGMTTDKINIIEKPKLIESAVQKPDKPQHMYSKSNPKLLLQLSNMSNLQSATPDSSQFFYENQNSSYHPNGDSRLGVNYKLAPFFNYIEEFFIFDQDYYNTQFFKYESLNWSLNPYALKEAQLDQLNYIRALTIQKQAQQQLQGKLDTVSVNQSNKHKKEMDLENG